MDKSVFYNVDSLKICYQTSLMFAQDLIEQGEIFTGFYKLKVTQVTNALVLVSVSIPRNSSNPHSVSFAELKIDTSYAHSTVDDCYAWLTIENSFLYSYHHHYNLATTIKNFADLFSLQFNNISKCDIAADVTYDASKAIFKLFREHRHPLIILGRQIKDYDEENDNIIYEHIGSFNKFTRMHIRIKGKDSRFQFYCYNKLQDIRKKEKEYILNKYKINPDTLYRMEVRTDTDHLRVIAKQYGISQEDLLYDFICCQQRLCGLWSFISKKFVRLKRNRRHILDILEATHPSLSSLSTGGNTHSQLATGGQNATSPIITLSIPTEVVNKALAAYKDWQFAPNRGGDIDENILKLLKCLQVT